MQSSVSLQHLPYDVQLETGLPAQIGNRLSFATQKLQEIVRAQAEGPKAKAASLTGALPSVGGSTLPLNLCDSLHWHACESKMDGCCAGNPVKNVPEADFNRPEPFEQRRGKQISTDAFPTTSIGSFPQTAGLSTLPDSFWHLRVSSFDRVGEGWTDFVAVRPAEIRRARLQFKKGSISAEEYEKQINEYIAFSIKKQEELGVDVLVHGEPERTDMCASPTNC